MKSNKDQTLKNITVKLRRDEVQHLIKLKKELRETTGQGSLSTSQTVALLLSKATSVKAFEDLQSTTTQQDKQQ